MRGSEVQPDPRPDRRHRGRQSGRRHRIRFRQSARPGHRADRSAARTAKRALRLGRRRRRRQHHHTARRRPGESRGVCGRRYRAERRPAARRSAARPTASIISSAPVGFVRTVFRSFPNGVAEPNATAIAMRPRSANSASRHWTICASTLSDAPPITSSKATTAMSSRTTRISDHGRQTGLRPRAGHARSVRRHVAAEPWREPDQSVLRQPVGNPSRHSARLL